MQPEELANKYNLAPSGNYIKKNILREIATSEYLLIIEPYGLIWPKKLSKEKSFSYTITQKQLVLRDKKGEVIKKDYAWKYIKNTINKSNGKHTRHAIIDQAHIKQSSLNFQRAF